MSNTIFTPKQIETETFEPNGLDKNILRKKGNSKTFSGWLIQRIKNCRDNKDFTNAIFLQELYRKYMEFETKKKEPLIEIEIVEGWKGIDNIEIFQGFTNDFIIKSHSKDKETSKVSTTTHKIKREGVNRILFWIKKWKVGEKHKCYDFAEILGEKDWKEVWKKRMDVYFPEYYYPVKILEAMGFIKYYGRESVERIK